MDRHVFSSQSVDKGIAWGDPMTLTRHISSSSEQKFATDSQKFRKKIFEWKSLPVKGLIILKELPQSLQKKTEFPGNKIWERWNCLKTKSFRMSTITPLPPTPYLNNIIIIWSGPEFNVIITMGVVTATDCLAMVERPGGIDGKWWMVQDSSSNWFHQWLKTS